MKMACAEHLAVAERRVRRSFTGFRVLVVGGALGLSLTFGAVARGAPERPNILLIMSDDMGWSDLGCYGGEIQTPNLDSLARGGLRFTQFYNTARCCPTRASLLTGLYPHQAGMGHMMKDAGEEGYRGDLSGAAVTIAEVLREAGYRTYGIGKWHVTRFDRPDSSKHNWPLQRGFEKYYGVIWGICSYYDPAACRGNQYCTRENDPEYRPDEYYFTHALSDNAVTFLQEHAKESPDSPFFMYVAYTAAHWPMHALEKDIAKYQGKYDGGYDALRQARLARLRELGLIDPRWEPAPTALNWDEVEDKPWELRCMEVYAAMIDAMDQGIGRIVAELERQGATDDTLILFLQDNGACAENIGRRPREDVPPDLHPLGPDELPAGGHPRQTRDGRLIREGPGVMPGGPDTYIAYGLGWANVSNTPFREYKHWVHEGGISTPLIVHWPRGVPAARRNLFVGDPAHLIDIMATCVDAADASYPEERKGERVPPMEGVSLLPAFEGRPLDRQEPLFWEHEGNRAVRDGKWKLVAKENQPWELYDMEADRAEMRDLAGQHPERVSDLAARWDAWAARAKVLPLGAWRRNPLPAEPATTTTVFQLEPGDEIPREEGPVVGQRAVTVAVEILESGTQGVLIAQGGLAHGYALYMSDVRPHFAIRRHGELTTISGTEALPPAPVSVRAVVDPGGAIGILVDGREVASAPSGGPLAGTPIDGLSVGHDSGAPVGDYPRPFPFEGRIGAVTVETGPRAE